MSKAIRDQRQRHPKIPLVLWGGILLLVFMAMTLPLFQTANRSLTSMHDHSPVLFLKKFRSRSSKKSENKQDVPLSFSFPRQTEQVDGGGGGDDDDDDDDDQIAKGTLSHQPRSYFHSIQQLVDNDNLQERCNRYGFSINNTQDAEPQHRRIFYGSLIAEEPWELFEIVATETFGIFEGMVFVESNRTQNGSPRPFRRTAKHQRKLKKLFGTRDLRIEQYTDDDLTLAALAREHRQRQVILKTWKKMGMTPNDVGYIADADETFTRDFLRAVQTCPYIPALDYETHRCFNPHVKIAGYTRMFETSPECLTKSRTWYHPDMILGACIELIGNETLNPPAPRVHDYLRAPGYGNNCEINHNYNRSFGNITGNQFPLWSAADFRRQCGGHNYELNAVNYTKNTAFHFHNFFADLTATRQKYETYGHAVQGAMTKKLENIGDDLKMLKRCVQNWTDAPTSSQGKSAITETQQWQREVGGMDAVLPPWPIYFMDRQYRQRKHAEIQEKVLQDDRHRYERLGMSLDEQKIEQAIDEALEYKRQMWAKEAQVQGLRDLHQHEIESLLKEAQESKDKMIAKLAEADGIKKK